MITPAVILIVSALLIGAPFYAWYTAKTQQAEQVETQKLAAFNDPFISYQLATTTLTNGNVLQTDGTNSFWVATSTLNITDTSTLSTSTPWTTGDIVEVASNSTVKSTSTISASKIEDAFLKNDVADTAAGTITFSNGLISQASSTFTDTLHADGTLHFQNLFNFDAQLKSGINRLILKSDAGNADAELFLAPTGSNVGAATTWADSPNTNNFGGLRIGTDGTTNFIHSTSSGSGTTLPLEIQNDTNVMMTFNTDSSIDFDQLTTDGLLQVSGGDGSLSASTSISSAFIDSDIARDSELHDAVTLSGTPDYITLSGQDIVRGTVDIGDDTNLIGGTNITLTGDTLDVDDAFLRNSGDTTTGNLVFNDNVKALFGTGSDASIYYDGSDFQFDSQEVGSGDFIFSNGNVGIGTTTATNRLSIESSSNEQLSVKREGAPKNLRLGTDANGFARMTAVSGLAFFTTGSTPTESMRINGVGRVGIGTTSPATSLHVERGGSVPFRISRPGSTSGLTTGIDFALLNTSSSPTVFGNISTGIQNSAENGFLTIGTATGGSVTEKLRIDSAGKVGIGTTSPATKLTVEESSDTDVLELADTDGVCLHNPESGSEVVSCSSERNLKENIREATSTLAFLDKFQIREYEIKSSGDTHKGVIVDELEEVLPEYVFEKIYYSTTTTQVGTSTTQNGTTTIETPIYETEVSSTTKKFATLPSIWEVVRAIQELWGDLKSLTTRVDEHDTRLEALEAENVELKARLDKLESG